METFLIRALQLIMSLSLLVVIHEMGHFLFARLFKIRVEKFCIFFDPWFSIFRFKPKNSDTQYVLGWLPLGGYVKISGMIDESMDTEQMKQPAQPWEFRSKPAWQRLLVMVAGVVFNFILAIFIYSMILFAWGERYVSTQGATSGMAFSQTAKNIGFQDGDILISADDVPFDRYDLRKIIDARIVKVKRAGAEVSIYIPEDLMQNLMVDSMSFAMYSTPFVIDSVMDNSPARVAGLLAGDSITAINGKSVAYHEYLAEVQEIKKQAQTAEAADSVDLSRISLAYYRAGVSDTLSLSLDTATYTIGVLARSPEKILPIVQVNYGFAESFPAGIALGVKTLKGYVGDMRHVFSKQGAKQLGGFATIGSIFPATWDWQQFWAMTAFLSIILAFMNILPIPALDGGHVLFLLYEIIARRKPSEKFIEYAQVTGMFLLLGLLVWANFNDIMRFLF